ncbi:RNA polymerase sigma-54 factor rpoN [Borrelia nietonii YOR]|uniref:RNA polymerase sigma-54 factor rpoN n=1 Tax=Borrelia nietonii YOR TaxID=1293576 RepID=A0ABN4C862_9SPIR|nr:RNA polymerase sigma-54 factor rpoN [Borrelia nietonii YOR]AHH13952.1 RNA polymerase sigma-54 factor rpoN [Borrelia hermsii MTW]
MIKQNLELTQKLQITQINTIKILSLDKQELIKIILNEIENNEYLQIDSNKIFFETLKTYKFKKIFYKEDDNNNKTQYEIALAKTSLTIFLKKHLLLQLRIQRLSKAELNIGETIINNLNNKGFYIINPYDFFQEEDCPQVTKMIKLIQQFAPIGFAYLTS